MVIHDAGAAMTNIGSIMIGNFFYGEPDHPLTDGTIFKETKRDGVGERYVYDLENSIFYKMYDLFDPGSKVRKYDTVTFDIHDTPSGGNHETSYDLFNKEALLLVDNSWYFAGKIYNEAEEEIYLMHLENGYMHPYTDFEESIWLQFPDVDMYFHTIV